MSTREPNCGLDEQAVLAALRALKAGDFSVRLPAGMGGTANEIAQTLHELAAMLATITSEIMRISHELGPLSRLGGQADVADLSGTWRQMLDEFNLMAYYLTYQLRVITEGVRPGNTAPITFDKTFAAQGEMDDLVALLNQRLTAPNP